MFPLSEVLFHFIKFNCKKKENPQSCYCIPKIRKQANLHKCFLRHAAHNSAFRILSLHSTKCDVMFVGSSKLKCYPHDLSSPNAHICSDWLMTKKENIKSSIWATVMKLSMQVAVDSSITHDMCSVVVNGDIQYLICIFVLIDQKKNANI